MFGQKLRYYREELGLTREQVAFRIREVYGEKCTGAHIQNWENGTNPKTTMISMLADVLGIPEQYLFDKSEKAIDMIVKDKVPMVKSMVENTIRVDMLSGYVGAGSVGHIIDMKAVPDVMYVDKMMIDKKYRNNKLQSIIVIGDSMSPYVDAGDIVMFSVTDPGTSHFPDGKYVIETAQGMMVKNLCFKCNGDIVISSCNKVYESETINAEASQEYINIVGMVVGRILKS